MAAHLLIARRAGRVGREVRDIEHGPKRPAHGVHARGVPRLRVVDRLGVGRQRRDGKDRGRTAQRQRVLASL